MSRAAAAYHTMAIAGLGTTQVVRIKSYLLRRWYVTLSWRYVTIRVWCKQPYPVLQQFHDCGAKNHACKATYSMSFCISSLSVPLGK